MKKILSLGLVLSLLAAPCTQAADLSNYGNIDTIMEDNSFSDTATRYSAVQLSFFPEYATRLGFSTAEDRLDRRDEERDAQALRAFKIVQENLELINRKKLSEPKKTEYDMLNGMIAYDTYNLRQNRNQLDPLLYAAVFDALYDLRVKQINYSDMQKRDLAARLAVLPETARQAEKNLTTPPSFISQLAMERAYYAYLSFDEMAQYLLSQIVDETGKARVTRLTKDAKSAIKNLFDLFKKTAQENTTRDFRPGSKKYATILNNRYFITQSEGAMSKYLLKNLHTSQQNLLQAVSHFPPIEELTIEAVSEEEIEAPAVAEQNENAEAAQSDAQASAPAQTPVAPKVKPVKKKKPTIATAADFYPLAAYLTKDTQMQDFIPALSAEVSKLNQMFVQEQILPQTPSSFNIKEIPAYYGHFRAYMFVPPFGTQTNPTNDLFIRLPTGDEEKQAALLQRDFNTPTLKLLVAGQLIPGLAYRSAYRLPYLSSFRKMYTVPTLRNGWEVYAQHLAQQYGYIASDEELLFLAWADYVRAVEAVVDFNLNTQRFTYAQALQWLMQTQGFEQAQAELILKQVTTQPGEAVSYIYGYEAIKNLRAKYQKKLGKRFNLKDFHSKLMAIGDIPADRLETEMDYAYELEKNRLSQAISSPFYM